MAKSLNKVMLIGNLGKDPEVRYLPSGQAVANFSLATNEGFKDKDGTWKDRPEWHKIVFFGKLAEIAGQYLSKGKSVYIEGRIRTREWQDKEGQKKYTTEIVGWSMIMLGAKGEAQPPDAGQDPGPDESSAPPGEDIPF